MSIASLYPSINPSLLLDFANSKVLDPRITFTRTTTATYYDGVTTAKAEENLFTYSQEFDNAAWSKTRVTVTANSVAAPDGTTTAETIDDGTAGPDDHYINNASGTASVPANSTYTLSCYAKEPATNSRRYFGFTFYSSATAYAAAIFDLQTQAISSGAQGSGYAVVSSSCTSVGNGWYRCVLTVTTGATSTIILYTSNTATMTTNSYGDVSYTGSNKQLYIWGAQLEQRSSATAYTATTTQAITNYIPVLQTAIAGQARFDHNPTTGESLGLLIEEARTNVCLQSEDFNTGWTLGSSTVSTNATIAPNGTLTADKIIPSSTGTNRGLYRTFTASGATTVSVYAKYGGYQWFNVIKPDGSGIGVSFDILNGVKGTEQSGVTGTITSVGNGWYRCTCTQTYTGTAYVQLGVASADNSTTVTVATNDVLSGTFIWGAQAETSGSSFATSYIPTTTTSATRNADAASMTGTNFSSWYNTAEGTLYAEATAKAAATVVEANNGSSNERIGLGQETNRMYQVDAQNGTYWAISYTTAGGALLGSSNKVAGAFKTNDFAVAANGGSVTTDTNGQIGVPTLLQIGRSNLGATGEYSNSTIKKIAYYPIRCTNAQLQALTV